MRVLVVGAGGWLGRPAVKALRAQPLPYAGISDGAPAAAAVVRLRDAIRPDEDTVVVNLCGLKWGAPDDLLTANALIPQSLAGALAPSGAHLVQVGSAAEYGISGNGGPIAESKECSPTSDYGITKLRGTDAVLATMPTATVLRPFNIVDADLPEGSPMIDVRDRIERTSATGGTVELLSTGTTRDYVSRNFVIASIAEAARLRPAGVFNVCSGVGVSMGELVRMVLDDRGLTNLIGSGDESSASSVVGDPARWRAVTGLAETLGCRGVVDILSWSARTGR